MNSDYKPFLALIRRDIATTDHELEELRRDILELTKRKETLDAKLTEFRGTEAWLARMVGELGESTDFVPPSTAAPTSSDHEEPQVTHGDVAERVLSENGKPMRVLEILQRMTEIGHRLPEPSNIRFNTVYSAMRRRDKIFINLGHGYWGLVGRDEKHKQQLFGLNIDDRDESNSDSSHEITRTALTESVAR